MERHEQERAVRKRADILSAAMSLALKGGLVTVTHRRVSEAADVSLSAIRYYYRTREDLLLACIDEAERERAAQAGHMIESITSPVTEAAAVAELLLRIYYGPDIGDDDLAGVLRFTADCSRETPQLSARLAELRESAINPQLSAVLRSCGRTDVDASLAAAVLDGCILAGAAEGRRDIAAHAVATLASVLQMAHHAPTPPA